MLLDQEAAKVVASIVDTADGHCTVCAFDLLAQLADHFPYLDWAAAMWEASDDWGTLEDVRERLADH